jgi:hypothetical protein
MANNNKNQRVKITIVMTPKLHNFCPNNFAFMTLFKDMLVNELGQGDIDGEIESITLEDIKS